MGLLGPGAAERMRKLEEKGVLTSYGAQIDPMKVGLPLLAFIQLRCAPLGAMGCSRRHNMLDHQ